MKPSNPQGLTVFFIPDHALELRDEGLHIHKSGALLDLA